MSDPTTLAHELRTMAGDDGDWVAGPISATVLREAADAIESLKKLLRCLENDYGIRASWDGLRRVWLTESVTAELDYIEDKSRWHELFGTPERAAKTAWRLLMCHITTKCDECPMGDGCNISTDADCDDGEAALFEWLRGDAE